MISEGRRRLFLALAFIIVLAIAGAVYFFLKVRPPSARLARLRTFWEDTSQHADWVIRAGERCDEAPFVMPTDGYIGFLWGDSFRPGHKHQGLDIFGPSGPSGLGETPVVAAHDGYLSRDPTWRSALILRLPRDPLLPERQIWLYYTHMADADGNSFIVPDFPAGTSEQFVAAGTLLGYQGNYSADPDNPTGLHLHFSIVRDDGQGRFKNELEIMNTLDPSPYLGFDVSAAGVGDGIARCQS